jgi:hypothetical protein
MTETGPLTKAVPPARPRMPEREFVLMALSHMHAEGRLVAAPKPMGPQPKGAKTK